MSRVVGIILGLALWPLCFAFAYEALYTLSCCFDLQALQWVIFGFLVYVVFYLAAWVVGALSSFRFLEVFEHEVIHAISFKVFLQRVLGISVTADAGLTVPQPPVPGCVLVPVALAPYSVPLLTIPLMLLYPFMPVPFLPIMEFLIGFTLAFHFMALIWWELHIGQSDLHTAGLTVSIGVTVLVNSVIVVLIACLITGTVDPLVHYFENALMTARTWYQAIFDFFLGLF